MKSVHQRQVEEFMLRGGQEVPLKPTQPSVEIRKLRAQLIMEEALETVKALGCEVTAKDFVTFAVGSLKGAYFINSFHIVADTDITEISLEAVIDGCCDVAVVTTGTLSACGIPDAPFQDEINQNNLLKFVDGVYRDENGKIQKPKNHPKPRIKEILEGKNGTIW